MSKYLLISDIVNTEALITSIKQHLSSQIIDLVEDWLTELINWISFYIPKIENDSWITNTIVYSFKKVWNKFKVEDYIFNQIQKFEDGFLRTENESVVNSNNSNSTTTDNSTFNSNTKTADSVNNADDANSVSNQITVTNAITLNNLSLNSATNQNSATQTNKASNSSNETVTRTYKDVNEYFDKFIRFNEKWISFNDYLEEELINKVVFYGNI